MSTVAVNPPKTPCTKGSQGLATATIPNICKMPGPPAPFVPTPLPNIGKSGDSPQGYSTSVKIEGETVAIQGAMFNSMGDIASKATGGGLISANTHGPTKFVAPGSMDVKIEGKNVQLLGDQMLNNCGPGGSPPNSATMGGLLQVPAMVQADLQKIAKKCNAQVNKANGFSPPSKPKGAVCRKLGTLKHTCCTKEIKKANNPNVKADVPCTASGAPAPYPGTIRPDVLVSAGGKVTKVFDFKFNCKSSPSMSKTQKAAYKKAFKVVPQLIHAW